MDSTIEKYTILEYQKTNRLAQGVGKDRQHSDRHVEFLISRIEQGGSFVMPPIIEMATQQNDDRAGGYYL